MIQTPEEAAEALWAQLELNAFVEENLDAIAEAFRKRDRDILAAIFYAVVGDDKKPAAPKDGGPVIPPE